jgi:REP element-mobilizing transposase RayT
MNRGDHRESIFCDDDDRRLFLSTLEEACEKTSWQIHSFCLMANHFHLVIETPNANLVADTTPRPSWLRVDRLLGEWGIPWDRPGAGQRFAAVIEARRQAELEEEFKPVRRGWCVGSEQFRQEMLRYIEEQRGKWHYGEEFFEAAASKAERLIREALQAESVARWRKGDPFKIRLAARLRSETTVTVGWIAQRLSMGSRGHLAHLLHLYDETQAASPSSNQTRLQI